MHCIAARRFALVALLLAALLSACCGVAHARVSPGFFGVVIDGQALETGVSLRDQVKRIASTGAGTISTSFDWAHSQPSQDGAFDFTRSDRIVAAATRYRLSVLPVVVTTPEWARLNPPFLFSPPADPARYAAYAGALVARYGPRGSFWSAHPRLPRTPIRTWQIWNEPVGGDKPDGPSVFWRDDQPFQKRYVPLLRAARKAIRRHDRGATVVLAGLVGRSWQTLRILYRAHARGLFDAVSLHPYTGNPADVVRIVEYVRRVMRSHRDGRLPIYVTEIGWPSFNGDVAAESPRKLAQWQSPWLRQTLSGLVHARRRLGIAEVLWYRWMGSDSGDYAFEYSGLTRRDPRTGKVTAKPALRAFAKLVHGARR